MWPTDDSLKLLLLGLLPLAHVAYMVWRHGLGEATSLGCLGVLFTWIGFHLSPWIFYFTGEWDDWVLCEEYIDQGLLFTTAAMLVFSLGYQCAMWKWRGHTFPFDSRALQLREIRVWWLMALLAVVWVLFVVRIGGITNIWRSDVTREQMGQGSWTVYTSASSLYHIAGVVYPIVASILALATSLYMLQEGSWGRLKPFLIGLFFLVAILLPSAWGFRRTTGQEFLILGLLALKLKGKRALPLTIACCLVILWLGNVGMNYRSVYYPGLGNFAEAIMGDREGEIIEKRRHILAGQTNPLDFMPSWTRKTSLAESRNREFHNDAFKVLWNLHPIPSTFLPSKEIGPSLSEVMNTYGSHGITTPALGELYYAMGYWGLMLVGSVGVLYGWCECRIRKTPTMVNFICFLLFMLSFPVGIHQGIRAMSRPIWYAIMLLFFVALRNPERAALSTHTLIRYRRKAS